MTSRSRAPRARLGNAPTLCFLAFLALALDACAPAATDSPRVAPPPTLTPSQVAIQQGVHKISRGYQQCYESLLVAHNDAAGLVTLRFSVRGDGAVEHVTVTTDGGELHNVTFERCLTVLSAALVFPGLHPVKPLRIVYPISFSVPDD